MNVWHFLGAIFAGRCVRFGVLSVLVIYFGPGIVSLAALLLKQHWLLVLSLMAGALCLWLIWHFRRRPVDASNL